MNRAALSAESTISTPPLTFGWLATIPIERPARRAKPTMISCAKRRLISNHEPASMSRSMTSYMSKYFRWSYGTISSMDRPALGGAASRKASRSIDEIVPYDQRKYFDMYEV